MSRNSDVQIASIQLHDQQPVHSVEKKKAPAQQQSQDALLYAFFQILESSNIALDTAKLQASTLQYNANVQEKLNDLNNQFNFVTLTHDQLYQKVYHVSAEGKSYITWEPKTVDSTTLINLEEQNQEVEKERSFYSNKIMLEEQNAQVGETELNTTVSSQQQSVQIDSSLLQMVMSVTSQICSMSR